MSLDKQQLRIFYKERRSALSDEELANKSFQITEHVITFLKARNKMKHFHLFFPISKQREVNTYPIKDFLEERGDTIYTARVESDSLMMQTLRLKTDTKFQYDQWGIPVPQDFELVQNEAIEVVFVPLLAYDKKGHRIGFGKGYYDVFLGSLSPSVLKIGLSFFEPEVSIPFERHDIPLDFCITPKKILTF